jgi:hypothetical protein
VTRTKFRVSYTALFLLAAWAFLPAAMHADRNRGNSVQSRVPARDFPDEY